jgi:hypothetical protein
MGVPQFEFDNKTLDFPVAISTLEKETEFERSLQVSTGGKAGSVFERRLDVVTIGLDNFAERDFYRKLQAWFAWAGQGEEYGFALDKDKKINTTLDGTAAAGQKVIPLTSTTGIQVGDFYKVFSVDFTKYEIIEVDSISADVSVTAVENLIWAYASGDFFQTEDYWPKVVSLDDTFPAVERAHGTFEFEHEFREVR